MENYHSKQQKHLILLEQNQVYYKSFSNFLSLLASFSAFLAFLDSELCHQLKKKSSLNWKKNQEFVNNVFYKLLYIVGV